MEDKDFMPYGTGTYQLDPLTAEQRGSENQLENWWIRKPHEIIPHYPLRPETLDHVLGRVACDGVEEADPK